jgi:ABC-2 type transport system ATP-binding protein
MEETQGVILDVWDLSKQYDPPKGILAVDGISFQIRHGEIFSLLGPNGAGKTTTIFILCGLLQPTKGDAWILGHSVRKEPLLAKEQVGVVPQEIAFGRCFGPASGRDPAGSGVGVPGGGRLALPL